MKYYWTVSEIKQPVDPVEFTPMQATFTIALLKKFYSATHEYSQEVEDMVNALDEFRHRNKLGQNDCNS